MIFSGFTQRKSNVPREEIIVPGQHSHCIHCHQMNCSKFADNVTSCLMVICELCGWRCHECKLSEHALTCPEKRVACLNLKYGCPHELKRSKMAAHLSVCPASVVICSEEWIRYPIQGNEKRMLAPLPREKICIDCGQLDIGLAMRDQRMLIDSLHAPRKLLNTLRNSLTPKYPAVPFPNYTASSDSDPAVSEHTSQMDSDDDGAFATLSKPHQGLKESIHSRFLRMTKDTADSLAAALEMASNVFSSTQNHLLEVSEAGDGSNLELKGESNTSDTDLLHVNNLRRPISAVESSGSSEKSITNPILEYLSNSVVNKSVGMNSGRPNTDVNVKQSNMPEETNQFVDHVAKSSQSSDRCSDAGTVSKLTLHDIGGTQLHKLMGYQPENGEEEIYLHKMLAVYITIDYISKYLCKPSGMYTFICAQNFRRDEYHWHFKNVHLDIHAGLSGWLEKRCPLANLGCTFSFQNLEPVQPNAVIYHSWLLESFGLRRTTQPTQFPSKCNAACNPENILSDDKTFFLPHFSSESELNHSDQRNLAQKSQACDESSGIADSTVHASPFLNNLNKVVKQSSSESEDHASAKVYSDYYLHAEDNDVNSDGQNSKKQQDSALTSHEPAVQQSHPNSQEQDIKCKAGKFFRVKPTVYTATNWDSKVLFQYDLEVENENELAGVTDFYHSLTNLPFELLRHIARQLDSFSLCNLALTCHLLRDVCCSLLDERGIVLLKWQKQRSEISGKVSWKVVGKRWMFSTSFEPIKSWKFTNNHPTIGDHLKVCPFNKDIVHHTKPFRLLPDQCSFS